MNRRSFLTKLAGFFGFSATVMLAPLEKLVPKPLKGPMTNEQKQAIFGQMLETPEGRAKLAASLTQPIRGLRMDHISMGCKAFTVEPLG